MHKQLARLTLPCLFLSSMPLSGCLEHRYTISILADQTIEVDYSLRGDRADIEDGNELLPDSAAWNLLRRTEETDEQTTHIIEGRIRLKSLKRIDSVFDWRHGREDSLYFLVRPRITSRWFPFVRFWHFYLTLPSREFNRLYGDIWEYVPEECRALEDEEALRALPAAQAALLERKFGLGIIQWNRARYESAFDAVWGKLKQRGAGLKDTTQESFTIAKAGWTEDIHQYLNRLDIGEPQTTNLNWWEELRPMFLGRMLDLADERQINHIGSIADSYEKRYLMSKDLEDDRIIIAVSFPGRVLKCNGDRKDGSVQWDLQGKALSNEEEFLIASAVQLELRDMIVALILALLLAIFIYKRLSRMPGGK